MWLGYLQHYPDYWTQGETREEQRESLRNGVFYRAKTGYPWYLVPPTSYLEAVELFGITYGKEPIFAV